MFWFMFCFFLEQFWLPFLEPFLNSKIGPTFVNFWIKFGFLFWGVLEFFGCLLGAFLDLLRLYWEASGPKNV